MCANLGYLAGTLVATLPHPFNLDTFTNITLEIADNKLYIGFPGGRYAIGG